MHYPLPWDWRNSAAKQYAISIRLSLKGMSVEVQQKWKASFLGVSWNSKSRSGSEWTLARMDSCADIEDGECEHEDARTVGIALLVSLNWILNAEYCRHRKYSWWDSRKCEHEDARAAVGLALGQTSCTRACTPPSHTQCNANHLYTQSTCANTAMQNTFTTIVIVLILQRKPSLHPKYLCYTATQSTFRRIVIVLIQQCKSPRYS